jgi:hypothetical protein
MSTITFDTLKFVTRLKEAGLSENQAIAITEAFRDAHVEAEVATKSDLREMEQRLIIKLAGMIVVTVGLVATVVKLIH